MHYYDHYDWSDTPKGSYKPYWGRVKRTRKHCKKFKNSFPFWPKERVPKKYRPYKYEVDDGWWGGRHDLAPISKVPKWPMMSTGALCVHHCQASKVFSRGRSSGRTHRVTTDHSHNCNLICCCIPQSCGRTRY